MEADGSARGQGVEPPDSFSVLAMKTLCLELCLLREPRSVGQRASGPVFSYHPRCFLPNESNQSPKESGEEREQQLMTSFVYFSYVELYVGELQEGWHGEQ